MATPAGDLTLLDHPPAQRLLSSAEPAQWSWVEQLRGLPSARIRVTPQWANVIDFETRLLSALG